MRDNIHLLLQLVLFLRASLHRAQTDSIQQHPALCLEQALNTNICHSQTYGKLCHEAGDFCLSISCIIKGIDEEGTYPGAKVLPCCQSVKVCGDNEINLTASACFAINVSFTTGVCVFSDNTQQQENSANENMGVFDLTVTSVIKLAGTFSKPPASVTKRSGRTTPTPSSSTQESSVSPTYIIIGVTASAVILFIIILTVIIIVVMLIKHRRAGNFRMNRISHQNTYSKLPMKAKDESTAKPPEIEPLYSTMTDALLPTHASPLYESITSVQVSTRRTAIQAPLTPQKAVEQSTTQPEEDHQVQPVYSTIVRREDGEKVTATIVDVPCVPQNMTSIDVATASNQSNTDAPKTSHAMSTDSDPPEDKLYSTIIRLDGEKVTVRTPMPKEQN